MHLLSFNEGRCRFHRGSAFFSHPSIIHIILTEVK